jgi:hypothetical protein
VQQAEQFLVREPGRLAFLLRDRLHLDQPDQAVKALQQERLSPLIRSLALLSLLLDLIENRHPDFHRGVLALLDRQTDDPAIPALRRPGEVWPTLEPVYRRAVQVYDLTATLARYNKKLKVQPVAELDFATFDKLWNQEGLNRLDYYSSDLERSLRVGGILPIPHKDFWPELAGRWGQARETLKKTLQAVETVLNQINDRFQDLYQRHYAAWLRQPDTPMIFTHQFLPRLLKAHWDPHSGRKAVIMVFDGLRTDAWDELLRPVLEERFAVIDSRPGSALLPTETQLSRKAISAGRLPDEFIGQESTQELNLLRTWLKQNLGLSPQFEVIKDDDAVQSGMTVRYVSKELEYIIFNFTDHNLHHNNQDLAFIYHHTVQTIIREDVRSVLRELPADALLFITSDHGFTPVPADVLPLPSELLADKADVKYRSARALKLPADPLAARLAHFKASDLGIPTTSEGNRALFFKHLLFPRSGYTLKRPAGPHNPDRYSHGGLSLAECLIPMVVMGPPQANQPALYLDSLRQVGTISEGEALTLEIVVSPGQIGLADLVFDLTFSRDEIPARRELFTGQAATCTVSWTPRMDQVTPAERERGEVIQPVTVILSYRQGQETLRTSKSATVRIKLDPGRIRRRVDSKLDLLMGKVPRGLK